MPPLQDAMTLSDLERDYVLLVGMLDIWFYETHWMIQDWQAEMSSW